MPTAILSDAAVALLRFALKGCRLRGPVAERPECRELAAAGLVELSKGEYRITALGWAAGGGILDAAETRREPTIGHGRVVKLSEEAAELLRRRLAGERVEITERNRPHYRELVASGMMEPLHTLTGGDESAYRLTELAVTLPSRPASCEASPARAG